MIYQYPFESNHIELSGHKIHYLDEGSGHTVVMLHGNPTWSYFYRNLVQELSSSFRVIVPDHIGCGLSDKPQDYDYTLENHVENLSTLITHLGVDSVSLVVHDWGGAIGFGYATRNIKNIKKIVVLNTAAFRSTRIPFRIRLCRLPVIGRIIVQGFNGFAFPATFMAVSKKMPAEIRKAYLKPYNSWKNRIATYRFVRDIPIEKTHVSYKTLKEIEEKLPEIINANIPLMICWGGKDFCFNDLFYEEWKKRFPDAICHYFKNAGHYILEDMVDIIEPIIDEFLKKNYS